MKRILIIDDDLQTRVSMAETFKNSGFRLMTASNGEYAMQMLRLTDVNLVICNITLPNASGYDLLSKIKDEYPSAIRVIMSDSNNEDPLFKAVLHNVAKFHMLKPWNDKKLLQCVHSIFETEDVLMSNDLLLLINNIEKLPTIDTSYQKILNMIERESHTRKIADEIEKDFAISTKLLQMANSAYYGLHTASIRHATVYLGSNNLKSLIYSTSIISSLDSVSNENKQKMNDLWTHSLLTSKLLHFIYDSQMKRKLPETSYSAGLLHNIGSLILIQNGPEVCGKITHEEAGGYLINWWELPFPIVESALYHHRPLDPHILNKELVAAVHLAQHYAWQISKQPVTDKFYPEVFDLLDIKINSFEAAVNWNKWI